MLRKLLRDRRGESLIEVMTAGLVFMMLLGTLCAGTRFVAGAQTKAQAIRERAVQFQQSARRNLEDGKSADAGLGSISFDGGGFSVPVRFQTVQATAREAVGSNAEVPVYEEKTAVFYTFAAQDAPNVEDGA